MKSFAEYLEGNRRAMDMAERETGQDPTTGHGPILLLVMHRIGRVSYALSNWGSITAHDHEGAHAETVNQFRAQALDFTAHAIALLERIGARVEAGASPGHDDATELCHVTSRAHRCTLGKGPCPSCEATKLLERIAVAQQAEVQEATEDSAAAKASGRLM